MDRERWRRVEEVFQCAAERDPGERDAFLVAECDGDEELRHEVESLLAQQSKDTPLDRPAWEMAAGSRLGPYELLEPIGSGGMGTVFKALDTRLDRNVAVKVSSVQFSGRFAGEARAVAALNHPHICTLYDVGSNYLVMEYLEGENLAQRLQKGALPLNLTLRYGAEIAGAVAAAHAHGIIHRDLKPANIMLTESGVKVLDFGLAKFEKPDRDIRTQTASHAVLGTAAYMSPEQAEGKPVDGRSDIFSLGVLLYEAVSGSNPFRRDSAITTLAAIMQEEPRPLSESLPGIPAELERIVARCLRKDPARRFQSAADLKVALEELRNESVSGGRQPANSRHSRRPRWVWEGAIAALLLLSAAAVVWRLRDATADGELTPQVLTSYAGMESDATISPDGNKVAFSWNGETQENFDIYVKQVGATGPPMRLTSLPAQDGMPAWSPDDRWIAFVRVLPDESAAIMLIPPLGGPERKLIEIGRSPWSVRWTSDRLSWTPDGKWLAFSAGESETGPTSLWALSVETGERRRLTTHRQNVPDAVRVGDRHPAFSPDGRTLAFFRQTKPYIFDLYKLKLAPDLRPEGDPARITERNYPYGNGVAWTPDGGEIIYGAAGLWRVPVSGRPVPRRIPYAIAGASPAIARIRPRLVYTWAFLNHNLWRLDTRTNQRKILLGSNHYSSVLPQYSPDGRRIAFQSNLSGAWEIWTCDADGANRQQLTSFGGPLCGSPHWSPDGQWMALDARVDGQPEIYVVATDGGTPRRITQHPGNDLVPSWSRDGRWIYFLSDRSGRYELWKSPREAGTAIQVTRNGGGSSPIESPDGSHVYYTRLISQPSLHSLFRIPVGGGDETRILPQLHDAVYFVTAKGIYFALDPRTIQFLDLATGKVSTVAVVDRPIESGLSVSPDGAYVIWAQRDGFDRDLMLVDGFR